MRSRSRRRREHLLPKAPTPPLPRLRGRECAVSRAALELFQPGRRTERCSGEPPPPQAGEGWGGGFRFGSIPQRQPVLAWLGAADQDAPLVVDPDRLAAAIGDARRLDIVATLSEIGDDRLGHGLLDP